jgi:hypothetical protein
MNDDLPKKTSEDKETSVYGRQAPDESPDKEMTVDDEKETSVLSSEPSDEIIPATNPEPRDLASSFQHPASDSYYLQVVKTGDAPEWPRSKEELDIYSQPLNESYIQYYAYPKSAGKASEDLPHAEEIASKNKSDYPVIIIDQIKDHLDPGECLELILCKDGHAWAKNESNLENLEDNISSLLETGRKNFEFNTEHFLTTSNVSPEVENRLNDLEEAENKEEKPKEPVFRNIPDIPPVENQKVYNQAEKSMDQNNPYFAGKTSGEQKSNKPLFIVPIILLVVLFGVVIFYREQIMAKIGGKLNPPKQETTEPAPVPSESPIPTPVVERTNYKVRVLNGTPTTGAAGKLADKIKGLGWQIDKTGNATNSAVAVSYVRIKKGVPDEVISTLISDVTDYEAASSSSSLTLSDKADLEFVIGKK